MPDHRWLNWTGHSQKVRTTMHHAVPLITTIAAGFGLALLLGFVAVRLKLPALVGYLLAGIVIGPATPGFVADVEHRRGSSPRSA